MPAVLGVRVNLGIAQNRAWTIFHLMQPNPVLTPLACCHRAFRRKSTGAKTRVTSRYNGRIGQFRRLD